MKLTSPSWTKDTRGLLFLSSPFILQQFKFDFWGYSSTILTLVFCYLSWLFLAYKHPSTSLKKHLFWGSLFLIISSLHFGFQSKQSTLSTQIKIKGEILKIQHALDYSLVDLQTVNQKTIRLKIKTNNPLEKKEIQKILPRDSLLSQNFTTPLFKNSNPGGFNYANWLRENNYSARNKICL